MSSKSKKDEGKLGSQESEDSMSQALADLGMLEQGMTLQDKRDLLSVVRLSQKSAEAEEEERKTKSWSPRLSPNIVHSSNQKPTEKNENLKEKNTNILGDKGDSNCIFSNTSLTIAKCNSQNTSHSTESNFPTIPVKCFGNNTEQNVGKDTKMKQVHANSSNICKTHNNKDCEMGIITGDLGVHENGCENEVTQGEPLGLGKDHELEIFPSSVKLKQKDCHVLKRKKDDKERNIDVFSHSSDSDDHVFNRKNIKKNDDRIPFYFVPEDMNIRSYIAYFKCYVTQYYKKLAVIQRSSVEHLEWGAPITLETSSSFTNFHTPSIEAKCDSASKRYNFRDRYPKPKLNDFTSENSEDAEEEESNDEDMFVPHHKKLPGIKLSTKRKNTSGNDSLSTKKEKKEPSQKKLQEDEPVSIEDVGQDGQIGDNPDKMTPKAKGATSSRKRTRKPRSKLLQTQNEISEDISDIVPNVAITSIIEPDIVIAEGPSLEPTPSKLDDITNRPSPLSVKQRRLQVLSKNVGRLNRRKSEPRKNPDIVIVDEEVQPTQEESVEGVRCPICWQRFPASDIEEHASECNQYSPDSNCSTAKV